MVCVVLQLEKLYVKLWMRLHSCVPEQVEPIEGASVARAAWTGVTLWDTSTLASLRSAPAGPQQPAAVRLGLCYGMQIAETHSNAGRDSCPGDLAVSDSMHICICDPRCVCPTYAQRCLC